MSKFAMIFYSSFIVGFTGLKSSSVTTEWYPFTINGNPSLPSFNLPADGPYVIGVVTTQTVAANSLVQINAQLQIRNA